MTEAERILGAARTVVVVDWPSRDVPDTLALAGYTVLVKGGPGPGSYSAYEVSGGEVVPRRSGAPESADLVYAHRPVDELPGIVMLAQRLGAGTIWHQSGLAAAGGGKDPHGCWLPPAEARAARDIVQSAGLAYLATPYIADEVRRLRAGPPAGR